MSYLPRFGLSPLFAMAVVLCATGCPLHQDQVAAASTNPAVAQDQATDPSAANLAPDPTDSNAQAPVDNNAQQSAPPPDAGGNYSQPSDQSTYDPGNGEQPEYTADQPPPPLPDYEQPQAPGDGYMWTPGYWAYGQDGYYWVPGVWVQAPYEGALWTPGYWGYHNNRYGFYRGYWGPHIGYYGGINYGFGYIGFGYQGGYWGGGHFNYNRSVNNINISLMHNVYNRSVSNNYGGGARVSFNGGRGGLQVRARPAELAARRETHAAPMGAQMQHEHAASTNRAQYANVNHGRPASAAIREPLAADRNVRAPAASQMHNQAQQRQAAPQQRQAAPQQRQAAPQQRQAAPQQRQAAPQQREAAPQQRQAAPQQRQAAPQQREAAPQQRQAAPQQRQAAPQQRQAAPQQRQAAPQQHQAAPQQHKAEEHPKQ